MEWVKETLKNIDLLFPDDITFCISLASCYIAVFSAISQFSSRQADVYRNTMVVINDKNVFVKDISNDILWNCNHADRNRYQIGFLTLVICLVFAYFFTTLWSLWDKNKPDFHWINFVSSFALKLSFVLLLTTYDVSMWDCIRGPADVKYNEETQNVDLKFTKSTETWQLIGSILSFVFFITCLILNGMSLKLSKCCDCLPSKERQEDSKQTKNIIKFVECAEKIAKMNLNLASDK